MFPDNTEREMIMKQSFWLRTIGAVKKIPFISSSATCIEPTDETSAPAMGAVQCLRKPREQQAFLDIIAQHKAGQALPPRKPALEEMVLKEYNEALKTSEERFCTAAESLTDVIFDWDIKEKVDWYGDIDGVMGYPPGGFPRTIKDWAAAVHPEDKERVMAALKSQIKGAAPYAVEYRVRRRDGEWRWWSARGAAIRDDRGEPYKMVGSITDITDRKQAAEKLRDCEDEFHLLAESMPQIVWVARKDGWNIYFNRQWMEYTGLTPEESCGHGWIIPFHPEDRQMALDAWQNAMNNQGTYSLECRLRRADGAYRWWLVRGVPLLDKAGEVLKWFGTCTDIHDIKLTAEKLRESESKFKGLFDYSKDAIFLANARTGVLLDANPAACNMIGLSKENVVGMLQTQLHPPEERGKYEGIFCQSIAEGTGTLTDMVLQRADGARIPVEMSASIMELAGIPIVQGCFHDISARQRAEEALQRSEETFRTVFDGASDGMFLVDLESRKFLMCNAMCSQLLGFTKEEFTNLHIADLHLPEDVPFILAQIGKPSKGDIRFRRKDGTVFLAELSATAITLAGRKTILLAFRDITERKRTEEELSLSFKTQATMNALLGLSLEGRTINEILGDSLDLLLSLEWLAVESKGAIFLADKTEKTLHLHVNRGLSKELSAMCSTVPFGHCVCGRTAAARTLQFSEQVDNRHDTYYEGMPPHGHYCIPILSGAHILGVILLYVKEGHTRSSWEEDFLKAIANTLAGAIEQKRAEHDLLASETRYRRLFESAKDGILILDAATGQIVDVNPYLVELLGFDRKSFLDKKLWEIGLFKDIIASEAAFIELQKKQYIRYDDLPLQTRDGRIIDVEFVSNVYLVGPAKVIQCNIRNITTRKNLEQQLRQALKMEAVGQLASGVAHDFNNILQAMVGYCSMLLDLLPEHGETHELAGEIADGTDRAAALTRQLLAFSRGQVLEIEDLEINEVVRSLTKMIRRIISENIEVTVIEGGVGIVRADRGQMEQVLLNLCINARDAMPEGGVLTIKTEKVEMDKEYCGAHVWATPGCYVLLSVSDTGCGIDAETQARIFEPFFTTKDVGQGTGLGLATVYGIVQQHQGMIQVYSEVDTGTTFKVYLPSVEHMVATAAPKAVERAKGGTETILVAEDDEGLRKLAMHIFERAGYTVLLAANGKEALDVFEKHAAEIDLCLLDVIMPKMGGKAVYDILSPKHPRLRFLFASGYSMDTIHKDFALNKDIELIQKPFPPGALLRKVREILDDVSPISESDQGQEANPE